MNEKALPCKVCQTKPNGSYVWESPDKYWYVQCEYIDCWTVGPKKETKEEAIKSWGKEQELDERR